MLAASQRRPYEWWAAPLHLYFSQWRHFPLAYTPSVEPLGDRVIAGAAAAPLRAAKGSPAAKEVVSVALEVEQLMADYPSMVNVSKKLPKAKHQVKHVIESTCPLPVKKAHYHRLDTRTS